MESVANNLIDKLSPEFIQRCALGLAALYAFLCVRGKTIQPIRRDKKGAFYLYSYSYDKSKKRTKDMSASLEKLQSDMKCVKMTALRTELLLYINAQPEKVEVIEGLLAEYNKQGGNSYITNDIAPAWREKYAKKITEGRI